jgi:hypothetical protein
VSRFQKFFSTVVVAGNNFIDGGTTGVGQASTRSLTVCSLILVEI